MSHDLAAAAFYAALAEDDPAELYDNAPCGYLSTLPDGTIIKANATFLAWTGYDRDVLIGRCRFQDLLAAGDRIFYQTHAAPMLLMQGMIREIAIHVIGASGSRLPMLMNAQLKRDEGGQPAGHQDGRVRCQRAPGLRARADGCPAPGRGVRGAGPGPGGDPAAVFPATRHRHGAWP